MRIRRAILPAILALGMAGSALGVTAATAVTHAAAMHFHGHHVTVVQRMHFHG